MQNTLTFCKSPIIAFQAEYQQTRKTRHKGGQGDVEKLTGRIFRDSLGRERIEQVAEDEHIVRVYDPTRKTEFMLDVLAELVLYQVQLPGEGFRANIFGISKSSIAIPVSFSNSMPELGWKEIEGLRCAGYKIQKPGDYTLQYWLSPDLEQLLLVNIMNEEEEFTWQLFNLKYIEPDMSYFDLPGNFAQAK